MDYGYDTRTPEQRRKDYTERIEAHLAFKRYPEATAELEGFLADCREDVRWAEVMLKEQQVRLKVQQARLETALAWDKLVRDFITQQEK